MIKIIIFAFFAENHRQFFVPKGTVYPPNLFPTKGGTRENAKTRKIGGKKAIRKCQNFRKFWGFGPPFGVPGPLFS